MRAAGAVVVAVEEFDVGASVLDTPLELAGCARGDELLHPAIAAVMKPIAAALTTADRVTLIMGT